MKDATTGRKSTINPATGVVTNTGYDTNAPIYCGVLDGS
jgi:hypothetical protein